MGISIAICELDAKDSLCSKQKQQLYKVLVKDGTGFEKGMEYDVFVPTDKAKKAVGNWEDFMKRNKFKKEPTEVYIDKLKDEDDIKKLSAIATKEPTGWVVLSKLSAADQKKAIDLSDDDDRVTEWDRVEQDEMTEICAKCKCSWDKGRGCMGDFGPANSMIPVFAEKHGCKILAEVVKSSETGKRYTPADAKALIKEVDVLIKEIPNEDKGKMYMNRYSGVLERLKEMAKVSIDQNCGFYFL